MDTIIESIKKEDDESIIIEGDTVLDAEVEQFVDSMNLHIDISKSLRRRVDEINSEIQLLHNTVSRLQTDLKFNQYVTWAFSASFAVTMLLCVNKRA
jgi:hypothetical protein